MSRPIPTLDASDLARFWAMVDKSGDCWECTGGNSPNYGRLWLDRSYYASHRISYFIHHGVDPGELFVCHTCDNPRCVNPAHLWLGTGKDNADDRDAKGRGIVLVGSQCGRAKLTEEDVRAILHADESQYALEEKYGVDQGVISDILRGKIWKHVKGPRHTESTQTNNISGVNGVSFCKRTGRWEAALQFQYKRYRLGRFDTIAEAERALITERRRVGAPDA